MKFLLITCIVLASLAGCVTPPPAGPSYSVGSGSTQNTKDQRLALEQLKKELAVKRQQLTVEKLQKQIDQLEKETQELQTQIADLQNKILQSEATANKATAGPAGKNVGPRGGCYTITKSGKKNYGGC